MRRRGHPARAQRLGPGRKRIHTLDTMGHNWWSAIVFGAGIASMAILDEDPVPKAGLNASVQPMPSGSAMPGVTWPANALPSIVTAASTRASVTPATRLFPSAL